MENINREENSFLRNNKEIRKQLKRIIPILEDVDDWQDKIYSITTKNFKISKEEYPTINLES